MEDEEVKITIDDHTITVKGKKGNEGPQGEQGPIGLMGLQGPEGKQGDPGPEGQLGKTGDRGPRGFTGFNGNNGDRGPEGKQGSPDTPSQIIEKINSLREAVETAAIKGLDQKFKNIYSFLKEGKTTANKKHGGGLTKVYHDTTLTGSGTLADPLKAVATGGNPGGNVGDIQYKLNSTTFGGYAVLPLANGGTQIPNTRTNDTSTGTLNNHAVPTTWLNFTGSNSINLTGLVAQPDGTEITISNNTPGGAGFTIFNQSISSTAANRIILPTGTISLGLNVSVVLRYDGNVSRWRVLTGGFGLSSGTNGAITLDDGLGGFTHAASLFYSSASDRVQMNNLYSTTSSILGGKTRLLDSQFATDGAVLFTETGTLGAGSLAADPTILYVDKPNKRVGMGTTTPSYALDVVGNSTTTNIPNSFTASLVPESIPSPGSDAAVLVYGPRDDGSGTGNETFGFGYGGFDTVAATVFSYRNVNGVPLLSPTGIVLLDGGTGLPYVVISSVPAAIRWSWSTETNGDGSNVDGYVIVINDMSAGSTYSFDVGAATLYDDQNQTGTVSYAPFTGITSVGQSYAFDLYTAPLSPSGNTYYTSPGSTSVTDTQNNGSLFQIQHTITGTGSTAWRELENTSAGFDGVGDQVFYQLADYSGSATVTPNHYGILSDGTTLTRDYNAYTYVTSPITLYSSTFIDVTTTDPNDGQYYSITYTFNDPGDGVRVLESINGGGQTGQDEAGGSGTFYQDALGGAFVGSTTVTPTAYNAPSAKFQQPIIIASTTLASPTIPLLCETNGTHLYWTDSGGTRHTII